MAVGYVGRIRAGRVGCLAVLYFWVGRVRARVVLWWGWVGRIRAGWWMEWGEN